ncbi:TPA: hypothetical protein LR368_002862 [Enterobacter hormaechei]|uniref:hypothetical protein n=1 Tax=Enterobacter hormaechei TaxID=158836 RepID=UPI0007C883B0|nr:hypothetical protein [Enterobacter hormaechei]OAH40057.1 hypothetical protein AYJ11_17075 [Enterobacter hormaechei subsp. xiangfangensis]HBL5494819.1 hypothetical protein [Enterobacter hormaechei]HBL9092447.1 hypothetical protein [Enterobacter hormaechei]HBL9193612.1 hypothetical protein [Enterobacter hormaechei]
MNILVTLIFADGRHIEKSVPATQNSVLFPADTSLYPPEETKAKIERFDFNGKTYFIARESQQAISTDRVKCVVLGID